jgi:predicted enzyme related to lactoylglutathione lyase
MLKLSSVMLGTMQPKEMAEFYEKILGKPADMVDGNWHGWSVGEGFLTVGEHSEMGGAAKDPGRVMFNFETKEVQAEFDRMVGAGAKVIKAPYQMGPAWIATLADPDGNFFQLMTPWES